MSNLENDRTTEIVRRRRTVPFAAIPAETMQDARLTMPAAAVLHYMIWRSGIPGWQFYVQDIVNHFNTGKKGAAVRTCINELIALGYVEREQLRDAGGRMVGTRYTVSETSPTAPEVVISEVRDLAPDQISRAAPTPQPRHVQPAPKKKVSRTAAEARQALHHRVLEAWNATRGSMPEMPARETDGRLVADKVLAMLIEELVKVQGGEAQAVRALELASRNWNAEMKEKRGGFLEKQADMEFVFRNASAASRKQVGIEHQAQRRHVPSTYAPYEPDSVM
ncbi:hypothetical protein [Deinococcus maricopensis]|uniref:Primosome, DnaD subunit n=1 Tax=Deinococcus maricopensis (strain DSM 21211 / LMG 22137 / NRRL B-23946 / LB-34) TaxID=709986 RepID=E8U613_DEIML|nr:hypothetical protein [Deinococcus maricopensis]ADV66502.1 hypothetical protein Deima_0847 [Deinococcus maricopensis DSM 21211]